MKGKKEIAILFFIMAVLVFYIKSEKGDKTTYKLPDIASIETGDVSRLTINTKGSEIVLLKENNKWLLGTQKYPADPSIVDKMLSQVSGLSLTALASESRSYSIYELDNDKKIEVKAFKGDNIIRTISIGKPASSYKHTFIAACSNGYIHYGPPAADYSKGGYEVTECLLAPEWQQIYEKKANEIIRRL